ncbi:alpha/beta hydrolase [Nocardioides cavernaquae]|uniref:Alpha/beta hydrolase n=1 Tax=Nocardioides cavernaquae TaxID=2321396 RepID=A0A3A5H817_9ACTN|nr:alpha/beta hydrolase [Nocardioides cavernaquae]RJS46008.1 alpha/beta hydrolase [Nocardioides cavernaquae]
MTIETTSPTPGTRNSRRPSRSAIARRIARNAWGVSWLGDGVEPSRPAPTEVLYTEDHATVARVAPHSGQTGNPVLLVTPLAVPVSCWDLRPGQSLAAHLAGVDARTSVDAGRPTYTIDYGQITFADRGMGFEDWVGDILPTAVLRISAEHGGAPVHLVGWSHGGTMSLLLGAHAPDLPIASISTLGTPTDYRLNPTYAGMRLISSLVGPAPLVAPAQMMGGIPAPLTQRMYRWMSPMREVTKPWTLASNLGRTEVLARIGANDRFVASMPGYPGRFINQSFTLLVARSELAAGVVHLREDFVVRMERLRAPLLLIGSAHDTLANAASVEAGVRAYPSAKVRFHGVSGFSHLGLIASPRAAVETWPEIHRHLAEHDSR